MVINYKIVNEGLFDEAVEITETQIRTQTFDKKFIIAEIARLQTLLAKFPK